MSQNELARLVGISSGYFSQLMSGAPTLAAGVATPAARARLDFDDPFTITTV